MRQERLHAAVGEQDLGAADVAGRGVALLRGGQVLPDLPHHPRECAEPEHQGAKNGVLM